MTHNNNHFVCYAKYICSFIESFICHKSSLVFFVVCILVSNNIHSHIGNIVFCGFNTNIESDDTEIAYTLSNSDMSFGEEEVLLTCATNLAIPSDYNNTLIGDGNFNAFIFGNQTAVGGDSEGRLFVGGNFTQSAGSNVNPTGSGTVDGFIVQGNFINNAGAWNVTGNFKYGGTVTGPLPSHPAGGSNIATTNVVDYVDLLGYYANLSSCLENQPTNGTVSHPNDWAYNLIGTGAAISVFNLTLVQPLPNGVTINVSNAPGTVIINVSGTTHNFPAFTYTGSKTKTLWNFYEATSISLSNTSWGGAMLATSANMTATNGNFEGQLVLGGNMNMPGSFEYHNYPFNGTLPVDGCSCTISCSLDIINATPTICNPATNTYDLAVNIVYSNQPIGNITIDVGGANYPFTPDGTSPDTYTITGLLSNGTQDIDVSATFAGDNTCTNSLVDAFDAPASCMCNLTSAGLGDVACNNNNTPANPTDDYIIFSLNPIGTNAGTSYVVTVSSGSVTPSIGIYGSATNFQLQAGSAGSGNSIVVTVTDSADSNCEVQANIIDIGACSTATCLPMVCVPTIIIRN